MSCCEAPESRNFDELVGMTNKALYAAKTSGRDCICSRPMSVRHKVMVVDDDRDALRLMRDILERQWDVVTCASGAECIQALALQKPDVILLDVLMPQINGVAVLDRLKLDKTLAVIPVILVSGLDVSEQIKLSEHYPIAATIEKPIIVANLLATVGACLN